MKNIFVFRFFYIPVIELIFLPSGTVKWERIENMGITRERRGRSFKTTLLNEDYVYFSVSTLA